MCNAVSIISDHKSMPDLVLVSIQHVPRIDKGVDQMIALPPFIVPD